MKLLKFLNEGGIGKDPKWFVNTKQLDMIKKDCKPFLDDLRFVPHNIKDRHLYRGTGSVSPFLDKNVRQDRKPLDSSVWWQKALNAEFQKKFKVRARSAGVFCKSITPSGYGIDYMLFPKGKYFLLWSSKVHDAYFNQPSDEDYASEQAEAVVDTFSKGNILDLKRDKKMKNQEVILICDSWYGIHADLEEDFERWMYAT